MKISYKQFFDSPEIPESSIYLILGKPYHLQNDIQSRLESFFKKSGYWQRWLSAFLNVTDSREFWNKHANSYIKKELSEADYDVIIVGNKIVFGLDFLVKKKGIETSGTVDVEKVEVNSFSVFPNPGNGLLYIDFPDSDDYQVRIYSVLGALVNSWDFIQTAGLVNMDVSNLQDGMYLIEIESSIGSETIKYMKR